ncbi:RNA polymerase sigma factor [Sporosarcina sp. YIM B06819]|uniref:RNA polymerase sigma factor n=1 Tax=Sporosarcina sp. YIM B06819 TaxID=3081769 RepID=UPI00298C06D5|nr:RNA polymerase sigma factor [Sporosarcina sp. YIM B06819]
MELLHSLNALIVKELLEKEESAFVITSISDSIQMRNIKKQDMQAIVDWFDVRQSKFYKIGWSYLKNHYDVEDVFHNTIIKVHDKIGQLRKEQYFETWVTSIFINECRSIYRKKNKDTLENPPEMIEEKPLESQLEVMDNLDQLENIHREVIILKYLQGFSQKEISHILNLPIGTVKSRLHRGLRDLRNLIESGESSGV